jgi:hypothetical protein
VTNQNVNSVSGWGGMSTTAVEALKPRWAVHAPRLILAGLKFRLTGKIHLKHSRDRYGYLGVANFDSNGIPVPDGTGTCVFARDMWRDEKGWFVSHFTDQSKDLIESRCYHFAHVRRM